MNHHPQLQHPLKQQTNKRQRQLSTRGSRFISLATDTTKNRKTDLELLERAIRIPGKLPLDGTEVHWVLNHITVVRQLHQSKQPWHHHQHPIPRLTYKHHLQQE
jgi:hypothetical protein